MGYGVRPGQCEHQGTILFLKFFHSSGLSARQELNTDPDGEGDKQYKRKHNQCPLLTPWQHIQLPPKLLYHMGLM
jgi:hypothetical protein